MKKFITSVLSVCFFVSCSTEEVTPETNNVAAESHAGIKPKSLNVAANSANSFDYMGELHSEILSGCIQNYASSSALTSVISDVETVALNDTDFYTVLSSYTGLDADDAEWTIDNALNPQKIINNTILSLHGKNLMANFIAMLDGFENKTFDKVYLAITNYESTIVNDNALTGSDKQTILVTTATARYSIAFEKNGGGRGWNKTKIGITASINNDAALAVTTSVTANIMAQ